MYKVLYIAKASLDAFLSHSFRFSLSLANPFLRRNLLHQNNEKKTRRPDREKRWIHGQLFEAVNGAAVAAWPVATAAAEVIAAVARAALMADPHLFFVVLRFVSRDGV